MARYQGRKEKGRTGGLIQVNSVPSREEKDKVPRERPTEVLVGLLATRSNLGKCEMTRGEKRDKELAGRHFANYRENTRRRVHKVSGDTR